MAHVPFVFFHPGGLFSRIMVDAYLGARAYAQKVLRHFAATGQKAPLLDPYLWVETERIVPELPQIKERQAAIYERPCRRLLARVVRYEKDKGFVAFECMLFVLLFALLISLCARAGGRFVALSSKLLSSWELRRAAVDLDCRFEHYFRYEALAVSIKKGAPAMCWSYGPVPRIKRSSTMRRPRPNLEGKPFTSAPRKE